jgi:C4-dicarboxylate-specific signal transduction histidine kinase
MRELCELAVELNHGLMNRWRIAAEVTGTDWTAKVRTTPLLQILDNLVHNACSWLSTMPEQRERRICIRLVPEAARLVVADTGPGIDEEAAPHVFEPFFSMKTQGKGLGLYISSELAARLGGTLRLGTSDEAGFPADRLTGATFVLDLDPALRVDPEDAEGGSDG